MSNDSIPCPFFTIPLRTVAGVAKHKPKRETEYHVHELDEHGDSYNVIICDRRDEAIGEADLSDAAAAMVERVKYLDGDRVSEKTIYERGTAKES